MPVLTTITVVTLIMRGGSGAAFLDPAALRKRLEKKLDERDTRTRALSIADDLERLGQNYRRAARSHIDKYAARSSDYDSSAASLIAAARPMDLTRVRTLTQVIRLRQSLLELLTPKQWKKVFG